MPRGKVVDESGHPRRVGYSVVLTGNVTCTCCGTVVRGQLVVGNVVFLGINLAVA